MSVFDKNQIFVSNLSPRTNESKLRDAFSKHGNVTHVKVQKDKNTGVVTFANEATVINLLASQMIGTITVHVDGRVLDIKPKVSREKSQQNNLLNPNKIFVGGLPAGANKGDLDNYFTKWGVITESYVVQEKNVGFVTFQHACDVQQLLMRTMTGEIHRIKNTKVIVEPATENRLSLRKPPKADESKISPNPKQNEIRTPKIIQTKPKDEQPSQGSSIDHQLILVRETPAQELSYTKKNHKHANTQTHTKGSELLVENEKLKGENEKLKAEIKVLKSSSVKKEKELNDKIALLQTKLKLAEINLDSLILAQHQK